MGSLLRTTWEQAGVVREVLERGARTGRARLDEALADRKRSAALAELGEIVLELVRRGEIDLDELPEIRDAVDALDHLDAEHERGGRGAFRAHRSSDGGDGSARRGHDDDDDAEEVDDEEDEQETLRRVTTAVPRFAAPSPARGRRAAPTMLEPFAENEDDDEDDDDDDRHGAEHHEFDDDELTDPSHTAPRDPRKAVTQRLRTFTERPPIRSARTTMRYGDEADANWRASDGTVSAASWKRGRTSTAAASSSSESTQVWRPTNLGGTARLAADPAPRRSARDTEPAYRRAGDTDPSLSLDPAELAVHEPIEQAPPPDRAAASSPATSSAAPAASSAAPAASSAAPATSKPAAAAALTSVPLAAPSRDLRATRGAQGAWDGDEEEEEIAPLAAAPDSGTRQTSTAGGDAPAASTAPTAPAVTSATTAAEAQAAAVEAQAAAAEAQVAAEAQAAAPAAAESQAAAPESAGGTGPSQPGPATGPAAELVAADSLPGFRELIQPERAGGINFDDDLEEYMHPDDVPPREPS